MPQWGNLHNYSLIFFTFLKKKEEKTAVEEDQQLDLKSLGIKMNL